jgi:anti-anti-sigma regulatory factor
MQDLQAAGHHVPEDLAVVGFDDMAEAQYASPSLTTVRTQFEALGRTAAEQLLIEISDGRHARACSVAVPATVLHRRSCGCRTLDEILAAESADQADASWQATLLRQLVQAIRYPLPLDPATLPEQSWPGAGVLVEALDAALHAQQPPAADFELVWRQAIDQTENLDLLHRALRLLQDIAERRLAITTSSTEVESSVRTLLRGIQLDLMRARVAYEVEQKQMLGDQVKMNNAVSMALLRSIGDTARSLAWLEHTPAACGGLGLCDVRARASGAALTIAGVYDREGMPGIAIGQQLCRTAYPPLEQLPERVQHGQNLIVLCPVRTEERDWGVLALSGWAGQQLISCAASLTIQAALLGTTLDRAAVLSALTEQQATLQMAYTRERMLSQTIRELGCPIIPLLSGVLLVPLIGAIDSQRAEQIISVVLEAIAAQRAQTVLLDVTGVPIVDTQVANSLIQMARAAMLLGARVVMVGIRPEIAQSIVGLGIDLQNLRIESTLASAIRILQIKRPSLAGSSG